MPRAVPHIALLTDYGTVDGYAGVLHGVIATLSPTARVIDLAHDVSRQDVLAAAYVLWAAYRFFPRRTIFLCVVDPGVGTARGILAVRATSGQAFIAPDNGLLSYVLSELAEPRGVLIEPRRLGITRISHTFHGRDIMAPAAAALANGRRLEDLGTPCDLAERAQRPTCPIPQPHRTWHPARILYADVFGNLITDVPLEYPVQRLRCGRRQITRRVNAYAEVPAGTLCFLPGSSGRWEVAVFQGSARARLNVCTGDEIQFSLQA